MYMVIVMRQSTPVACYGPFADMDTANEFMRVYLDHESHVRVAPCYGTIGDSADNTLESLTPKQRALLDAMPKGEWIRSNGSVTYAYLERLSLIERKAVYEHTQYGRVRRVLYRRTT